MSEFQAYKQDGETFAVFRSNDGATISYMDGYIQHYSAADIFFVTGREINLKQFLGKAKMSDTEGVNFARAVMKRLGYPIEMLGMMANPRIKRPNMADPSIVPRLQLRWENVERGALNSLVLLEIETEEKLLKSMHVFHYGFREKPPKISDLNLPP